MSKFTFDCFVCNETLETESIDSVIAFGEQHGDCDEAGAS